ncbi:DUF3040 domain-containing protein [Actinomadura welshii]
MSLPLHESRVLALIEMGLRRDDRELAERFAMFNQLSAAEAPRRESAEPSVRLCFTLTAAVLVAVLVLGLVAAAVSG